NTLGVQAVHHLPISMIETQLHSVLSDIPVHAFKTGMIANIDMMEVIEENITDLDAHFVLDPVMVATSGDTLINEQARNYIRSQLIALTSLVTPPISDAELLIETNMSTKDDMENAAIRLVKELGASAAVGK